MGVASLILMFGLFMAGYGVWTLSINNIGMGMLFVIIGLVGRKLGEKR